MYHSPFSFDRVRGAVRWLILINAALFIFQQFVPAWFEINFGLIPFDAWRHLRFWQFFTYLFLHGSFFHVLINMFTLWMFGKELEVAWGTKEFLKFYFLCGVGAGIVNTLFEPYSTLPIIGASGAIYGLLVAYAMLYPDSVIYLYAIVPLRAKHFVVLIGLFEFLASFDGLHSGVARFAHLGGMGVGYFYLKFYEFRSFLDRIFQVVTDFFVVKKASKPKNIKTKKEDLAKEVDRILEKVLLHGTESLTEAERETMRRYSSSKH